MERLHRPGSGYTGSCTACCTDCYADCYADCCAARYAQMERINRERCSEVGRLESQVRQ